MKAGSLTDSRHHSGIINNAKGGCFNIQMIGNYTNFIGSTKNGLTSVGFPSVFPMAFQMAPNHDIASCSDLRAPALAFNVLVTALLVIVLRPKPVVLFWALFCIGFWHISLFSDPRSLPPPIDDAFGAFLPALFVGYAFWRLALRFTLPPLLARAPLETAVLFLGPWWVGVLSNMTFDNIPIERLIPQDIRKQPGGIVALIIICIVLLAVVVNQVRVMRKTGWLLRYAGWYACGGLVALVLAVLPGLQFRLHHYVLAMALMPGTAWPTRLSAVYQGVLLGLFLNGIAAYGFDSILQTNAEVRPPPACCRVRMLMTCPHSCSGTRRRARSCRRSSRTRRPTTPRTRRSRGSRSRPAGTASRCSLTTSSATPAPRSTFRSRACRRASRTFFGWRCVLCRFRGGRAVLTETVVHERGDRW
jgi:hypothetical protein